MTTLLVVSATPAVAMMVVSILMGTRGGSQGRGKGSRWRLNRSKGRCQLSSPGSRRGRPRRWFSLFSRRCRIRFGRTPLKPNISRI